MSYHRELSLHIESVRKEMERRKIGALFISEEPDLRYLTGKDTGRILLTQSSATLWVKGVYQELYHDSYSPSSFPLELRIHDKKMVEASLRQLRTKTVGVSNAGLLDAVRKASRRKTLVCDAMKSARCVKTKWELSMLARSCRIARAGMRRASEVIGYGVPELYAVAEIEALIRRKGSCKPPFDDGMLLASGRASADIHAKASLRRIGRGPVVVDLGACWEGYHSDMTRTIGVGRLTSDELKVMDFVRDLRDEAIGMIAPGMRACDVHKYVEDAMKSKGYAFHHLSGHGVGLEIHEYPGFAPGNKTRLAPNMVFTVEPGIYLPGKFGVRFEDTVLLTRSGCRKLT